MESMNSSDHLQCPKGIGTDAIPVRESDEPHQPKWSKCEIAAANLDWAHCSHHPNFLAQSDKREWTFKASLKMTPKKRVNDNG